MATTIVLDLEVDQKQFRAAQKEREKAVEKEVKQFQRLQKEIKLASDPDEIKKLNKELAETEKRAKALGTSFEKGGKGGKGFGASVGKSFKSIGAAAGPVLLAITAVVAAITAIGGALSESNDVLKQTNKLFGATGDELEDLATSAIVVADAFDKDVNEVLTAANVLSKQFGISAEEALDLVSDGFIKGADANGEFLDILKEYPTQLKSVGLNAKESIAIITQTQQQGIFSDKGIDAIKEAGLSLREMTKPAQDALKAIGLSGDEIQKQIEAGTLSTFEAIQLVSTEVGKLPEDSAAVGAVLADVFKGAGEDAGAGFVAGLATIDTNLEALPSKLSPLEEANMRLNESFTSIQVELTNFLIPILSKVVGFFADMVDASAPLMAVFGQLGDLTGDLFGALGDLAKSLGLVSEDGVEASDVMDGIAKALQVMSVPLKVTIGIITAVAQAVEEMVIKFKDFFGIITDKEAEKALDDLNKRMIENAEDLGAVFTDLVLTPVELAEKAAGDLATATIETLEDLVAAGSKLAEKELAKRKKIEDEKKALILKISKATIAELEILEADHSELVKAELEKRAAANDAAAKALAARHAKERAEELKKEEKFQKELLTLRRALQDEQLKMEFKGVELSIEQEKLRTDRQIEELEKRLKKGEISNRNFAKAVEKITSISALKQADIRQKAADKEVAEAKKRVENIQKIIDKATSNVEKAEREKLEARIETLDEAEDATEEFYAAVEILRISDTNDIQTKFDEELAALKANLGDSEAERKKAAEAEIALRQQLKVDLEQVETDADDRKTEKQAEDDEKKVERDAAIFDAAIEVAQKLSDAVFNVIAQNEERKTNKKLDEVEKGLDAEHRAIDDALAANAITEEQAQTRRETADAAAAAKKESLEEAAFEKKKTRDTIQAVINTAIAVTQALASSPPPVSFTLAGVAAAAGAIQIGVIQSQKFEDGGLIPTMANGGMVNGPSHANGGVKYSLARGGNVELEGGEGVINKRAMSIPSVRNQASRLNQIGGGVTFADGGILGDSFQDEEAEDLVESAQANQTITIQANVVETEMTSTQRRIAEITQRATIR